MHHYFPLSQWKITFLSPKQLISLTMLSKLYIPSTTNTKKELLRTFGHMINGLVSGRFACEWRNLQNLRFIIPIQIVSPKFRVPKKLERKKNLWFILLMPTKSNILCQNFSQLCIVLGIYFFDNVFFSSPLPRPQLLHKLYNISQWGQTIYKVLCIVTRLFSLGFLLS